MSYEVTNSPDHAKNKIVREENDKGVCFQDEVTFYLTTRKLFNKGKAKKVCPNHWALSARRQTTGFEPAIVTNEVTFILTTCKYSSKGKSKESVVSPNEVTFNLTTYELSKILILCYLTTIALCLSTGIIYFFQYVSKINHERNLRLQM